MSRHAGRSNGMATRGHAGQRIGHVLNCKAMAKRRDDVNSKRIELSAMSRKGTAWTGRAMEWQRAESNRHRKERTSSAEKWRGNDTKSKGIDTISKAKEWLCFDGQCSGNERNGNVKAKQRIAGRGDDTERR